MQLPVFIRETAEKLAADYRPTELKKISAAISDAYLNNKRDGSKLISSYVQATVYSLVRMPATFAAIFSALESATGGEGNFQSMLDAGAGTGAAYFAASELFGITSATLVERENSMLSVAKEFCKAGDLSPEFVKSDLSSFVPDRKYDLVTASYATNEMDKVSREQLLDKLLSAMGKLLLIVEPGTPDAFALQKEIRQYLTKKGATLVAPCPCDAKCPLPENDWCHFSCRVERSRLHKFLKGGDAPYEDEKFTYSAFCTDGSLSPCKARVLRHPVTEKGRITLSVCTGDGTDELVLRKGDDGYKQARKLGAGDAFDRSLDA